MHFTKQIYKENYLLWCINWKYQLNINWKCNLFLVKRDPVSSEQRWNTVNVLEVMAIIQVSPFKSVQSKVQTCKFRVESKSWTCSHCWVVCAILLYIFSVGYMTSNVQNKFKTVVADDTISIQISTHWETTPPRFSEGGRLLLPPARPHFVSWGWRKNGEESPP